MTRRWALLALSTGGFLAAVSWPLANFINANYTQLAVGAYGRPYDIAVLAIAVAVTGIGISAILGRIAVGLGARMLCVLSAMVFATFWSATLRVALVSFGVSSHGTLLTAAIILVLLAVVWKLSCAEPLRVLIAIASILALALPSTTLVATYLSRLNTDKPTPSASGAIAEGALSGENVYYIILDAYSGDESLMAMGYDNASFLGAMGERGYLHDAQARSNYLMTHLTLMAILEADYPVTDQSARYTDRSAFYPAALNHGYRPAALRDFAEGGYHTIRISNDWGGCNEAVFTECLVRPQVQSYSLSSFLEPTIFGPYLEQFASWARSQDVVPDDTLALLQDYLLGARPDAPYFLFVHHLSPHAPYTKNADCSPRSASGQDALLPEPDQVALYLAATTCVNAKMLEVIDTISRLDPHSLVVVQSDHGSSFGIDAEARLVDWPATVIASRSDILSLVKLPAECEAWAAAGRGQVNTMRLVLGCLRRTMPTFLPETTYLSAYETSPDFGNVVAAGPL